MELLDKYFLNIGEEIGQRIIERRKSIYKEIAQLSSYNSFSKERILYHVICDRIFDASAFEFFTGKKLFFKSKPQPGNRDYMIFGYEDNEKVEKHSNSSNNYRTKNFIFNSFGDSMGTRKDMFRFFRKVQNWQDNSTPFETLNLSYIKIIEDINKNLAEKCGQFIWKSTKNQVYYNELSKEEKNITNFLKELEYVSIHSESDFIMCKVPVFEECDNVIIDKISNIILNEIYHIVKTTFYEFEENAFEVTAIRHEVNINEIAIELWHQVFGFTNEYLAKMKFVQKPEQIVGEGRYLRSFSKI